MEKTMSSLKILVLVGAIAFVAAMVLAGFQPASADRDAKKGTDRRLVGLWQGVQSSDGALATLSVRDQGPDGAHETTYHEAWFGACAGGRGVVNGSLAPIGNNTYQYDRTVFCPDLGTETFASTELVYHPDSDLLVFNTGQPLPDTFHRISTR
jgi:hypothetical protein